MGNASKQVCRLCLQTVPDGDSENIDGAKKGILKVLLINIDFDISNETVACNTCLTKVQDCFDFKSNCLYVDDYKGSFLGNVNEEGATSNEDMSVENVQICQLCMSSIEDEPLSCTSDSKEAVLFNIMIRKCLPEVTLNAVSEPLICKPCVSSTNKYDEFMEICHKAEQRIQSYRDVAVGLGVEVVLTDLLEYEICHTFSQPISITTKEECLDAESDTNVVDCPEKEDIASIKLEEVHIKEETEDAEEMGNSIPSETGTNSGKRSSLQGKRQIRKSASKGRWHFCSDDYMARQKVDSKRCGCQEGTFKTERNHILALHMIRHKAKSEIEMHKTENCEFQTSYKRSVLKHRDDKAEKKLKCDKCSYKTEYKSYLRRHNLKHMDKSEVEMYKCENCEYETRYKYDMMRHMVTHRDPKAERKYKCKKCPYVTDFKSYLCKHNLKHKDKSEVNMHKCENCEFETRRKSNMIQHMVRHRDPEAKRKFKCDKCPYETDFKSSLLTHNLKHKDKSEVMMHKCDNCDYETRYKSSLKKHMRKPNDSKAKREFKCDKCPYETDFKTSLRTYNPIHKVNRR